MALQVAPKRQERVLCSLRNRRARDRRRQRVFHTGTTFCYSPLKHPRLHFPHRRISVAFREPSLTHLAPQDSLKAEASNSLWAHADQNMRNPLGGSWNVYQGIVYVLPSQPSAAFPNPSTTVLLPKSHLGLYNELMAATSPYSRSHYCEITHLVDQSARCRLGTLFRQGCRRVPAPEGSLLLWNSKTLHQAPLPPGPRVR